MSTVSHTLHRETEAAKALLANLADVIGDDAEFAANVVEGQTSLIEAIDRAVLRLVDDEAARRGLDEMITGLCRRRDRIEARITIMRTALTVALEQAGRKKIEHPAVTLSLRPAPRSVSITDEALIPSKFWKASDPRLSKKALLEALKAKETVPGAELSNGGQTLQASWS